MPGRHEAADLRPFLRQLTIFLVVVGLAGLVLLTAAVNVDRFIGSSEAAVPRQKQVAATSTSRSPSTSAAASAPSTPSRTTTSPPPKATTTSASSTTTQASSTTTAVLRPPAELTVLVLNGTGRSGLAARVSGELGRAGYQTLQPDNTEEPFDTSRVWFAPGFEREARRLGNAFPDARLEPYPEAEPPANMVVVLGTSYQE
ncbi:MAG: LytR C-terminal domain-containing protein [Actinomycetota bacterium]|nr:LytR C-terminal domain-containing protein [Actinomycetota bacterium]